MSVVARDVKFIDRMQHTDSCQVVMTTSNIYLQSKVKKLRLYFRPEMKFFGLTQAQNLGCPKFSSYGEVTLLLQDEHFCSTNCSCPLMINNGQNIRQIIRSIILLIKQKLILIKQNLNSLPIIQSIHIINFNIGNIAQNGCFKLFFCH